MPWSLQQSRQAIEKAAQKRAFNTLFSLDWKRRL